jgi:hypothetical protein
MQALPGSPDDGHTLAQVIPAIEQLVGNTIERLHADAGYRGHDGPPDYKFKIYTCKQKRRVTPQIKREIRRLSAVEPVIGHLKEEYRMGRSYLAHRHGEQRRPRCGRLQLPAPDQVAHDSIAPLPRGSLCSARHTASVKRRDSSPTTHRVRIR